MSNKIKISYNWDKETFINASKAAYDFEMKNSPKRFLGWFFIAMTQFGVVAAMKKGAVGLLLISTVLVVYWYFFRWAIRKRILLKSFKNSDSKNKKFDITADSEGLHLNKTLIKWNTVDQIVSLKEGFLIYANDTFLFFPSKAFRSIEEKNDFAKLAKNSSKNYLRS